jgi:RNA polymerase sigma-70 factor (ECF subfamily)
VSDALRNLSGTFLANRHRLMAFILGLTRDPGTAEDVLQETWMKLAEAAERGTPIEDPLSWCRTVAKNFVLMRWRRERSAKVVIDSRLVDLAETAFREQDGAADAWDAHRRALMACVKELPDRSRRMLSLRYEHGLPVSGVARQMRKSYDAVMMALSRLRRALAGCVQRKLTAS